ncbi:MAG: hypothetical protein VYE73_18785 [Acidobacteriota bacterium]|nr:hypothetical protein [Acidobacteriota bacterium]
MLRVCWQTALARSSVQVATGAQFAQEVGVGTLFGGDLFVSGRPDATLEGSPQPRDDLRPLVREVRGRPRVLKNVEQELFVLARMEFPAAEADERAWRRLGL